MPSNTPPVSDDPQVTDALPLFGDVGSSADYRCGLVMALAFFDESVTSAPVFTRDELEQSWTVRRGPRPNLNWVLSRPAEPNNPDAACRTMFDYDLSKTRPTRTPSFERAVQVMRSHDSAHPRREREQAQAEDADHPGPAFIG